MLASQGNDKDGEALESIKALLARSTEYEEQQVRLGREQNSLAKKLTENTASLLELSSGMATETEMQTSMAKERTGLPREQTRLSTRSTELSNIRTDLARERNRLAEKRTDFSVERTSLAEARTGLAKSRTLRARTRTRLSLQRTELARGRTYLAVIRTGLAFLTIGLALFRYFGVSYWTAFDGALVLMSIAMVVYGAKGFHRARTQERKLDVLLTSDAGLTDLWNEGSHPQGSSS